MREDNSRQSGSLSMTRENLVYYTKMKTIPKVTLNLHGKLELSEQAKLTLKNNRKIT